MPKPIIDNSKCTNCGTCVGICPMKVFEKGEKAAVVKKPEACVGCRACEAQCPEDAIKVVD
jgi:NAD-dependent dihydropyrimidine dehydrogenase PreA subunit